MCYILSMTIEISPTIKEKSTSILTEIKKAKSILLHCHPSPDPDSVCSALAMKFAIQELGGKATVIRGDSEIPQAFMHFPGAKEIVMKNFWEIDLTEFDLFVILDSSSPGMISQIKIPEFPLPLRTIVIDHHITNKSFADVNLVDNSVPATAFILFQLFKEWGVNLTRDIALNLFMGIYTDTGGFKYPPTDYRVLQSASELTKIVPDFTQTIFVMENSEKKEALYFAALALNSIETFCNDHLAVASIDYKSLVEKGIPLEAIGGDSFANRLKSVIGWNVGVVMIETEPNKIKVSLRSRDPKLFDVSKLAASLGGGGHSAAAGIKLSMSLTEAKKMVVAKAGELYTF